MPGEREGKDEWMTYCTQGHILTVCYRSVTLVGEADRKMLKAAIKHSSDEGQVRHRQVPGEVVAKWSKRLDDLKNEVAEILQEEREEKQVGLFQSSLHSG